MRVAPDVALFFVEQEARRFAELEKRFKLRVDLKDDPQLKRGQMRVFTDAKKHELTKQVVGDGARGRRYKARIPTSTIQPAEFAGTAMRRSLA